MILYRYIASGQGHTTPWGQTFDVNRKSLSLCPFTASLKKNLILCTFLMILYIYTAPGQGQNTPWGQTFDVNRKPLSLCPFVAGLKKIALKSNFLYIFSCFTIMYIAPGRGRWLPVISDPGHFVPTLVISHLLFGYFLPSNNHFVPWSFHTHFGHFVIRSTGYEMTIWWSVRTQVILYLLWSFHTYLLAISYPVTIISYPGDFVPILVISYLGQLGMK